MREPDVASGEPAPSRAWRVALGHLEHLLLSGDLAPGDHLPPERKLAADLGVARSSVREAIRVLDALGLVRTATGSGPTAGAVIVASPTGGMSAVMRLQVAAQGFPIADIVEARLVVEPAIAAHLADAAAPELGQASALLTAMEAAGLTPAEFLALDARFHVALAEATGNTVLAATMAGLRDSIEGYVLAAVPDLPSWADTVARLRAEHRAIVAAVARHDAADAARRVREHVAGYWQSSREPDEHARPAEASAPVERHSPEHNAEARVTAADAPRSGPHLRTGTARGAERPREHADSGAASPPRS